MDKEMLERIRSLCLFDDIFMSAFFKDLSVTQTLIQALMQDKTLLVERFQTQYEIQPLSGSRAVKLDIIAYDSKGAVYNIEVQQANTGASPHRARYHASMLDFDFLKANEKFDTLPNTYVIFITKEDYFDRGKSIYNIERVITTLGESFNDGTHIMYVNGQYESDDELGNILHDFRTANPRNMKTESFRKRAAFLKEKDEGVNEMSKLMEKFRIETLAEGEAKGRAEGIEVGKLESLKAVAKKMLSRKTYSNEEIADVSGLPLAVIQKLAEQMA